MNVAYVRVSTAEQNEARQVEALRSHNIDKWFTEKISGKNTHRPQLQAMLDFVREGDTVYIHDFSRLARSTKDLLELVEQLQAKGVHLISNKEHLDTSTPTGKLMLTMIAAINEFERANTLERQREGIAIAKRNGVYKGRQNIIEGPMEHCRNSTGSVFRRFAIYYRIFLAILLIFDACFARQFMCCIRSLYFRFLFIERFPLIIVVLSFVFVFR